MADDTLELGVLVPNYVRETVLELCRQSGGDIPPEAQRMMEAAVSAEVPRVWGSNTRLEDMRTMLEMDERTLDD